MDIKESVKKNSPFLFLQTFVVTSAWPVLIYKWNFLPNLIHYLKKVFQTILFFFFLFSNINFFSSSIVSKFDEIGLFVSAVFKVNLIFF